MTDRTEKIDEIFWGALQVTSPEQRSAYLDQRCGENSDLRALVEKLLRAQPKLEHFLERPLEVSPPTIDQPPLEKPGTQIGPYKLIQEIGEGGMGIVYMAEQHQPVRRKVAFKIIKPGMDTRRVIARFEAERQALSLMDHPNIAKVLDAGATDSGRPYFVMELVKGQSITEYCDEHHLTPRQRLELLLPVCQAIQHAHQKGIIHRDIKPSNILVAEYDQRPVPKVIDFGVAKATGGRLTEKTMFTGSGQIIGTLEYMSPEQAKVNQLDIDTRSDIYSLGVLLYELLTGTTPFGKQRLRSAAWDEMLRIIREEEPPKPSTRLSDSKDSLPSVSALRHTEPAKLSRLVRGELDWIVMKALEKDRTRRYETASSLAADLQHYLNDEPVAACPPSAVYRLGKFARRNKVAIATTGIVAASLVLGLLGITWQAVRATVAERQARENEQRATQNERRALDQRDQKEAARREAAANAQVAKAAAEAEAAQRKIAEAAAQAERQAMEAEKQQRQKAETAEKKATEEAAVAKAVNEFLQQDLLRLAGAEAQLASKIEPDPNLKLVTLLDRALATVDERFADQPRVRAEVQATLAASYGSIGRYEEAVRLWEQVREHAEEVLGPDHLFTLRSMEGLASAYTDAERFDEAIALHLQTVARYQAVLGSEHTETLTSLQNLAATFQTARQPDKAIPLFEQVVDLRRKVRGPTHPLTLLSMNNLATAYGDAGQTDKSLRKMEETFELMSQFLGPEHPYTVGATFNLATVYSLANQPDKALPLHRQAFDLRLKMWGPEHPLTLYSMGSLGMAYLQANQPDQALPLLRSSFTGQKKQLGEDSPRLASMRASVGSALLKAGQWSEAQKLLSQSLAFREQKDPDNWLTSNTRSMLGASLLGQQKYAEAEPLLVSGYAGMKAREQQIPPMHRTRLSEACERLVRLYTEMQQPVEATKWRDELQAQDPNGIRKQP